MSVNVIFFESFSCDRDDQILEACAFVIKIKPRCLERERQDGNRNKTEKSILWGQKKSFMGECGETIVWDEKNCLSAKCAQR